MRKSCLLVLLVMSSFAAISQSSLPLDTLKARYDNEVLHFMRGDRPAKGVNGPRIGYYDLRYEYGMSPDGMVSYKKFYANHVASTALLYTALAAFTGAIISINNNNDDLSAGLFVGGFVAELVSIPFGISARKHLHRSVWLRNRDVLLRTK